VQANAPPSPLRANWLPAPKGGNFSLYICAYWPRVEVIQLGRAGPICASPGAVLSISRSLKDHSATHGEPCHCYQRRAKARPTPLRICESLFRRAGFTGVLQPDCTRDFWIGAYVPSSEDYLGASQVWATAAHDVIGRNVGLSKNTVIEIVTCEGAIALYRLRRPCVDFCATVARIPNPDSAQLYAAQPPSPTNAKVSRLTRGQPCLPTCAYWDVPSLQDGC
jgi:hypothetical protein